MEYRIIVEDNWGSEVQKTVLKLKQESEIRKTFDEEVPKFSWNAFNPSAISPQL